MLVASGAIGIYFSWRETKASLVALQVEKAESAATRIEQYVGDIAHQISWTVLPRAEADGDALGARRIEYLKLQRRHRRSPRWPGSIRAAASSCASRAWRWTRSGAATTCPEDKFRERGSNRGSIYAVDFRKGTEPYMTIARPAAVAAA